jgi:hypothetical protein
LGKHPVRPWLAETFPTLFQDWHCEVTALELERTFWEKATILHAEHHRPEDHDMPLRHARHYSDFACLLAHPRANAFIADSAMFLTEPQTFAELIRILTNAEQRINGN